MSEDPPWLDVASGSAFVLAEVDLAGLARRLPQPTGDLPVLVAVNGASSSGKTRLSARLAATLPNAAVVHTDDLAWHHAVLAWDGLLVDGVLTPVRARRVVSYRPPAWDEFGRVGAVEVPAGISHLLVEGVGVGRADLHHAFDVRLWVTTPRAPRLARDEVRVGAGEIAPADYLAWMAAEDGHFAADRPWDRADIVVDGTFGAGTDRVRAAFPRG